MCLTRKSTDSESSQSGPLVVALHLPAGNNSNGLNFMQVFVYEFITGGGLLSHSEVSCGPLMGEALAMVTTMANDFARMTDVRVTLLCDSRLEMPSVSKTKCWNT